ncbi:8468_t:CDS:2 [Cetraspora pellucida]|uniref:8468_t:CDS:1 n=1 Tax=Cetraspora pellucida TaxID=1433469 RepID=A0A9N8VLJ5_9GLOM|nr:8468_t:CDS:2 [Cetraspora pellucida]
MTSDSQHNQFFAEIVESSSDDNNDNIDVDLNDESSNNDLELVQVLSFYSKTLKPEISHHVHPKSDDWVRNVLFNLDETRFRRTLRINKSVFFALVNQIQNHSVFYSNANNIQTGVHIQLAVTLFHLGSLSTIWAISTQFGIAEGTVHLFMDRVITAIRSLRSEYIKWPQGDYKKEVHKGFHQIQEFPLVIGAIDGEEYLLGYSAYPLLTFVMTPFKAPNGLQKHQQINYNIKHSKTKVVVEQAFGCLKARFLFLRVMKIRDPPKGVEIIETALIIHNFIEKNGDIWGQIGYNSDRIEIQPEEDSELVDQILDINETNLFKKEYAKIK